MPTFFDLLKYAKTGIAAPDMTAYDKLKAMAMCGGGLSPYTIIGQPPISFKSDGTPLTSVTIKGNGQQQGTPSPQNIVPFDGTGVRTANLYDNNLPYIVRCYYGEVGNNFVANSNNAFVIVPVEAGKRYYVSGAKRYNTSSPIRYCTSFSEPANGVSVVRTGTFAKSSELTIDIDSGEKYLAIFLCGDSDYSIYGSVPNAIAANGETLVVDNGYKIPLTAASVTTPLYLGEVSTVRRIKRLELDGTEGWQFGSSDENRTVCDMKFTGANTSVVGKCSHIDWKASYESTEYNRVVLNSYEGGRLFVSMTKDLVGSSVNAFKQYLAAQYAAGTPVTVWYVLNTPTTGIVNEPLYRIGDYCDELTTTTPIPTAKGSNTLSVDTTVQPSEVSITGNIKPV